MDLHRLPRHILSDIIDRVLASEPTATKEILSLRLVCRRLNNEVLEAFYDRNITDIHAQVLYNSLPKPTGHGLQRYVRGFLLRPEGIVEVLNTIRRSLRDAALILTVLSASNSDGDAAPQAPAIDAQNSIHLPDTSNSKIPPSPAALQPPEAATDHGEETPLPDHILLPICNAYIDLLGEELAFESLDPTWARSPAKFEVLEGKTGHFWSLLAIAHEGRPELVEKATKACSDRYQGGDEDDVLKLKTTFAAALLVTAKRGHVDATKTLLAHEHLRINLRLQNIRFPRINAMEAAIESSQDEIVRLLLDRGWNFTTVPLDYVRALKATVCKMKDSPLRDELLKTFLTGQCQQWRSDHIATAMFQELSQRGDLKTCSLLMSLLKEGDQDQTQWKWKFDDDRIRDSNPGDNEEEEEEFFSTSNLEQKSALFRAVSNNKSEMIKFIFENQEAFSESMSHSFSTGCRLNSFEHIIEADKETMLSELIPYRGDVDPRRLFVYATLKGKIWAMTALLPMIDLSEVIVEDSEFWNWWNEGGETRTLIDTLSDGNNPNNFCFPVYSGNRLNMRLGSFTLLCAVKYLIHDASTFLLERNCEIGTRMVILSPNLIETRHARLFLPHALSTCKTCIKHTPGLVGHRRTVFMLSLAPFSLFNFKQMLDHGTAVPARRTVVFSWRGLWRLLWWWRPADLAEMDARIITAINIPKFVYDQGDGSSEDKEKRFQDMRLLMRTWRMPDLYLYTSDHYKSY